jgi:hypothetical protein
MTSRVLSLHISPGCQSEVIFVQSISSLITEAEES